jgi:hypothetical protein
MKKKIERRRAESRSAKDRFIAHLQAEIRALRSDLEFYRGRVMNLDLAIKEFGNEPQRSFVERTDRQIAAVPPPRKIEDTPVQPPKSRFAEIREHWASLSEEEQTKAIESGHMPQ